MDPAAVGSVTYIAPDGAEFALEAEAGITVMQLATSHALPGIIAECGGSLSCATCHVYVHEDWFDRTGMPSDAELTMLEFAEDPKRTSRLSCQIRYRDDLDGLVVRIPNSQ